MQRRSPAQVIEAFHLAFLIVLCSRPTDWFVLKGGANLRYFFGSPRYSNDIDFDFTTRPAWGVARSVQAVLDSAAMVQLARTARLEIVECSAPKQTPTTLRWKIAIRGPESSDVLRTKIEFSGRNNTSVGKRSSRLTSINLTHDDTVFESVPDVIVRPYALQAPALCHYGATSAINQKIAALALRSETKARDIFDLDLLSRQRRAGNHSMSGLDATHAKAAAARALEISYASFVSEVAPFLDDELLALYNAGAWDAMCRSVAEWLNELRPTKAPKGDQS